MRRRGKGEYSQKKSFGAISFCQIWMLTGCFRLVEILGRMFPSVLKGREGLQRGEEREDGGGGGGGGGGDGQGGGRRDENDSSEIVIGRVGEELGRRSKTSKNKT